MQPLEPSLSEAQRVLRICNACRYCEGYCAAFGAMTRRLQFAGGDLHYLAHLCHNCGACLYACQYAPPHEFAVNVPRALAQVRRASYEELAWPRAFAALYRRHGVWLAAVLALALSAFLVLALALNGTLWREAAGGNFYAVFPHGVMVSIFGPVFLYALLALAVGARRFWRHCIGQPMAAAAAGPAAADVLRLKNLDGGHGEGCPNEDDRPSRARRRLHQVTLYGFLLCFASTAVATLYHYGFGWQAPYAFLSVPVLLGTAGGIGLLIGPAGLYWLARRRDPQLSDPAQAPLDTGLMLLLLLTSATGLALLAGRATPAMPLLLAVHLGCVLAFFLTMPYGKFAHAVYRSAALLAWAAERRQPNRLRVGGE